MKSCFLFSLLFALLADLVCAQDRPDLTDATQKISYALGMKIIASLRRDEVDIDMKALAAGMADMQAGNPVLTPAQQKELMMDLKKNIEARADAEKKIAAVKNLADGKSFLAANGHKEGVMTIEATTSDGFKAEMQYQILKSGTGPLPKKGDVLRLHYEGRLIDGTVFDSSLQRGVAWTGRANDFIAGWTEPLQRMKVGDKWRLFIPPSLGYGEFVPYNMGPNSTLIYDIELLGIEKAGEPSPAPAVSASPAPSK